MKSFEVSLLSWNPASGLALALKSILHSCSHPPFQVWEESIDEAGPLPDPSRFTAHFRGDILFLIFSSPQIDQARSFLQGLKNGGRETRVIGVMEDVKAEEAVELLNLGIDDFLTPPLKSVDVLPRIWRILKKKSPGETLLHNLKRKIGLQPLVGKSPCFEAEVGKIPLVAKCDASVLICGETGTGKEIFARAVHYLSPRAAKPFIPVSCGAIPVDLMENELFGHARGAYTGAAEFQPGLIREAEGGTLFLDDIDCLPLLAQVKVLRLLQEKEYRELGSTKVRQADIRLIAATNLDLERAVREGKFRQDLYYRLNIIPLALPPLRERMEDILLLARHFLDKYSTELNKPVQDFSPEAMQRLLVHDWPGNVRELENVIERAVIFSRQSFIQKADIQLPPSGPSPQESFKTAKAKAVEQFERKFIQGLLLANGGNITQAARAADKNRRAFWELIRKHKIDIPALK